MPHKSNSARTHTQHVIRTRALLELHAITIAIIVQRVCPELNVTVTSQDLSLTKYVTQDTTQRYVCSALAGDVQRLNIYPEKGFQAPNPSRKKYNTPTTHL